MAYRLVRTFSNLVALILLLTMLVDAGDLFGQAVDNSPYAFANDGGTALTVLGNSPGTVTGYARIQPNAGSPTPAGMEITSYRTNGNTISELIIPSSAPVSSGRLYAISNGPWTTGVIFANPNGLSATVSYTFTDAAGVDVGTGALVINAGAQTARFFNQLSAPASARTFSFSSTVPIAAAGLLGFTNEIGNFLMTSLPVVPLSSAAGDAVAPQWRDGGGYLTT